MRRLTSNPSPTQGIFFIGCMAELLRNIEPFPVLPIAGIAQFSDCDSGFIEPCGGESGATRKVRPTTSISSSCAARGITDYPHASWRENIYPMRSFGIVLQCRQAN